jgi:hypothetical protein
MAAISNSNDQISALPTISNDSSKQHWPRSAIRQATIDQQPALGTTSNQHEQQSAMKPGATSTAR